MPDPEAGVIIPAILDCMLVTVHKHPKEPADVTNALRVGRMNWQK
jgi:hypothetical protein